jgi:hypothetical protein
MTLTNIDLVRVDTALTKLREACDLLSAASPRNARKVHAAVKCVERAQLRIVQRLGEVTRQQNAVGKTVDSEGIFGEIKKVCAEHPSMRLDRATGLRHDREAAPIDGWPWAKPFGSQKQKIGTRKQDASHILAYSPRPLNDGAWAKGMRGHSCPNREG